MEKIILNFALPECLTTDDSRAECSRQITKAMSDGSMPILHLTICPNTSDKDIYHAIQLITGINKFLDVQFQLEENTEFPYFKICQSWLPNATVVM